MKEKITLLFFMLVGMVGVNAQSVESKAEKSEARKAKTMTLEERVNQQVEKRTKQLELTPSQQAEWKKATMDYMTVRDDLKRKKDGPVDKEERKAIAAEMKTNQKKHEDIIMTILNPEQELVWEEIRKKEKERSQQRRAERSEQRR